MASWEFNYQDTNPTSEEQNDSNFSKSFLKSQNLKLILSLLVEFWSGVDVFLIPTLRPKPKWKTKKLMSI